MNFLDLAAFVFASAGVMIIFVAKTNLEKSKVRVKANRTKK
ncbi:hypothetical protein SHI21_20010 [Bacteriovorax sp. PP10]|uniref:Uncharacterized protein n=1 Tax=Bacteriovorax antarcticus TaxID=3088717 RepID=A0ABU5W136_9BACT|nr:hypothetical protein [Bacteriovorax sp. PP10]MEA9358532.1 hypothetical protein [Bacteriovorax sp. PP10]